MAADIRKNPLYRSVHIMRVISFAALSIAIIALAISLVAVSGVLKVAATSSSSSLSNSTTTVSQTNLGSTLLGIDQPLNATQLAAINNAPNSYFQTAGEMYLNNTLTDPIFSNSNKVSPFTVNGKQSVVYLGSITCIFCGENRWAMALALSRFGSFSQLFKGYSALGDGDVPTLYWSALNYNASGDDIRNYYSSSYVKFVSIEDTGPIKGGFQLNPPQQILANLQKLNNQSAVGAFQYIMNLSSKNTTAFKGTPYTIWGKYQFSGADAEVFGNTTPVSATVPLTYMTHSQILSQISSPTSQFAWGEYAAADVYVASICKSINNTASVCSLSAIRSIENMFQ